MGEVVRSFTDLREAARAISRDAKSRQTRVLGAVGKAARHVRNYVARESVPKAFGELAESIHVVDGRPGNSDVVADAPYAEAVEVGSRPHMPPIEPLIRWVQLRGLQGITKRGGVIRNRTRYGVVANERLEAAKSIGHSLRAKMTRGRAAAWRSEAAAVSPVDAMGAAPEVLEVARAIQHKIAARGTKPHRYMALGVPVADSALDRLVTEALQDK